MIATAVALALIFWTPAGGTNPCPDGVKVDTYAITATLRLNGEDVPASEVDGWAIEGAGCAINLREDVANYPLPRACATVAHELGHSLHKLPHEPGTIMDPYTEARPIPGACYPRPPHKGGAMLAHGLQRNELRRAKHARRLLTRR